METVRMAGCVFAVSLSSSSEPSKQMREMEKPSTRLASSKTARATGNFSASSLPMPGYCDACPGNRNASLLIEKARFSKPVLASGRGANGPGRKLVLDLFVHLRAGQPRRDADCILDGVGVRAAVRNHGDAADTQERRAAVFGIINLLLEILEGAPREQRAHLRGQRAPQRFLQQAGDELGHALAGLQRDVADEAVADDHVHVAGEDIAALDVAHEIQR